MQIEPSIDATIQEWNELNLRCLSLDSPRTIMDEVYTSLKQNETSCQPYRCLESHSISSEMRSKMVDWMIEVLSQFGSTGHTFFLAVSIMDRFFGQASVSLPPSQLHVVGVTCIFIASKFEDVHPLKLKVVWEKVGHRRLSEKEIRRTENFVVSTIDYSIGVPLLSEVLGYLVEKLDVPISIKRSSELILVLSQVYYNNSYTPSQGAASAVVLACKSLKQFDLVPMVYRCTGYSEPELEGLVSRLYDQVVNYESRFKNFKSAMKFMGFRLGGVYGELFTFTNSEMQQDQERLLAGI